MSLLPSYFTVLMLGGAPLPPPQMQALERIEIETAVGQASMFRLHFEMSRSFFGGFDVLDFDLFRPLLPISVRVARGTAVPLTLVNGYVRETRVTASNTPGASRLEVVCIDALGSIMAQRDQPFPYPNSSDDNAASLIFGRNRIIPRVDPVPMVRPITDGTNVQRGTDAEYLFELAERLSYELYIQPEPVTGQDVGHLHRPQTYLPPQAVLSIDFGIRTNLESFSVEYDALRPTTVATATVDPTTRTPIPAIAPVSTDVPMGLEPSLLRVLPPNVERPVGSLGASPAEAQIAATARATETSRAIRASGRVDGLRIKRPLFVGLPVLVRGAGPRDSGLYQVDTVTTVVGPEVFEQSFSAWRNAVGLTGAEVFLDPLDAI